jgi:endonuclease
MVMQHFNVVIPREDGGIEVYPMKEWLRQHPDHIPPGLDATSSTSHKLRDGLKKLGWSVESLDNEVRLVSPGTSKENIDAILGEDGSGLEDIDDVGASFALEYQLHDFIAQNIGVIQIEDQKLRLYVDPTGRDGIEYPTAVGPIDILAIDDSDAFIVFELKRGRSPDHAIGQLTRYMGWVKQIIGKENQVRGVIVAKTIGKNLKYAVAVIPQVSLFEYEVSFQLKPITI